MTPLKSHDELAGILGLPLSTTIELRKREGWPCVRLGRKIRFTDEQIEQIIATHVETGEARKARGTIAGQTSRSARRRAS